MKPWLCAAGEQLRDQIDTWYPDRRSTSDGWIGDARHSATIVIGTIHPCNKLERDSVRHLRYSSSLPPLQASAVVPRVGVEPITFYCQGSSNLPTTA